MATKKKLLQAAAGSAGGAGLDVDEVFSTYLFNGSGSTSQDIVNGIDLSGEGGLVWHKSRSNDYDHALMDTENGVNKFLRSNTTAAIETLTGQGLTSFNSNGYTIVRNSSTANPINGFDSSYTYASWTFRKAPKFFDVVTYTGTGSARTVSHNLGSVPGCIIVKRTDGSGNWAVYHRGVNGGTASETYSLFLDATNAQTDRIYWNDTAPTGTEFTLGADGTVNGSGSTYVAYLFAHNDGDGEFGPDSDQDIIKCGSYTSGNTDGSPEVNLGFEPQWVMIKSTTNSDPWVMIDTMRGFSAARGTSEVDTPVLKANVTDVESSTYRAGYLTQTGFLAGQGTDTNENNQTYIYIAIRRGPLAEPTSAADVFDIATADGSTLPQFTTSTAGPIDTILSGATTSFLGTLSSRLIGTGFLKTYSTGAELTNSTRVFDYMNGYGSSATVNSSLYGWMWKRAPSFFDVVAYTGNATAGRTVSHNLGVAPEMMWVKRRNTSQSWFVYYKHDATTYRKMYLEQNVSYSNLSSGDFNNTLPTDSVITLGSTGVNRLNDKYIAYLFATVAGISKVGSYTGNGTNQNIDCGFSSGARFVLIKRTDSTGDWCVYDTERGLVAGDDKRLELNTTDAQDTNTDSIDPYSAGFNVVQESEANLNVSNAEYIFYAIA